MKSPSQKPDHISGPWFCRDGKEVDLQVWVLLRKRSALLNKYKVISDWFAYHKATLTDVSLEQALSLWMSHAVISAHILSTFNLMALCCCLFTSAVIYITRLLCHFHNFDELLTLLPYKYNTYLNCYYVTFRIIVWFTQNMLFTGR